MHALKERAIRDAQIEFRSDLRYVSAARIETELVPAVRKMLAARGSFPMFDHGLSTNVGFEEHCRCLTRLHALCGSADLNLGAFPRLR